MVSSQHESIQLRHIDREKHADLQVSNEVEEINLKPTRKPQKVENTDQKPINTLQLKTTQKPHIESTQKSGISKTSQKQPKTEEHVTEVVEVYENSIF